MVLEVISPDDTGGRRSGLATAGGASALTGARAVAAWAGYLRDPLAQSEQFVEQRGLLVQIGPVVGGGERPVFHLAGPALAKEVFGQPDLFKTGGMLVKGPKDSALNRIRRSYFAANGGEHAHYQKLFKPYFRRKTADDALEIADAVAATEIARWPLGGAADIEPLAQRLTVRLASAAFFRDPDAAQEVAEAAAIETTKLGRIAAMTWRNLTPLPVPGSTRREMLKQAERAETALLAWAESRRGADVGRDILSTVVNAPDENGCPASQARIVGYAWNMFGATYDTTTSIISWALILLSQHPEIAAAARGALENAGWRPGEDPARVLDCPEIDGVMREALRLMPPAPFQRRKATRDTMLGGVAIPERATVIVSAWSTHRLSWLYPQPRRFAPERWAGRNYTPFEWISFSAGPRRCPGIWFAEMFIKLTIAHVLARRSLTTPPGARIDARVRLTLRPHPSAPIRFDAPDVAAPSHRLNGKIREMVELPR